MKSLTPEQAIALSHYKPIWDNFPYEERSSELTGNDEKVIAKIYQQWRGESIEINKCDECINEAFDRLMNELMNYEKAKQEAGQN